MRYEKQPRTVEEQARLLVDRGIVCDDLGRLQRYLHRIGYYRLSAYWLPFEQPPAEANGSRNHKFVPGTTFQDVLDLYIFDRKLRLMVIEAIERIEVAIRARWANELAVKFGSHAHMQHELFESPWNHAADLARIAKIVEGSSELFVAHYRKQYKEPFLPPIWAVVETLTLGALSCWYSRTRDTKVKQEVAKALGMPTIEIMEGVLHVLTNVRNICAHHGRLWNRKFVLQLPKIKRLRGQLVIHQKVQEDGSTQEQLSRHIYNYLVVLANMVNSLSPTSRWKYRLRDHVRTLPADKQAAMGFPEGWCDRQPWLEPGQASNSNSRPAPADRFEISAAE